MSLLVNALHMLTQGVVASVIGYPSWAGVPEDPSSPNQPLPVGVSTDVRTHVAPVHCPGFPEPAWALETKVPKVDGGAEGLVCRP